MGRTITLGELPPAFTIKPVKLENITRYGEDNNYPTRMERIISSSITAKSASKMLARFLIGKGFVNPELNNIVVGKDEYQRPVTSYKLLTQIANSIAKFNGFYVRVQYDGNYKVAGLKHESFKYCRFGMLDDQDYSGKIVLYNNWDKYRGAKTDKEKFKVIDIYNPRTEVVKSQVRAIAKKLKLQESEALVKYKGQVYFNFIDDEYIYPISPIDPVSWDADTESQIGKFKNGELRRGFFLKYIVHHTQFESKRDAEEFVDEMKRMMGGDHEISIMVMEGRFDKDGKLIENESIKVEKIEQNINDKIFEAYETSTQNNIRRAFDAIPQVLIDYEDSKLGTTSGEALIQACNFYNSQTLQKRDVIKESFTEPFKNFADERYNNVDWEINPLTFQ
ncbi:MAG: hypothetical protein WC139_13795 [Candidatus Kapaibacterium sp.]